MPNARLRFFIDAPEPRVINAEQSLLQTVSDFDIARVETTELRRGMVDFVAGTGMLRPVQLLPEWLDASTAFARLTTAQTNQATSAYWRDDAGLFTGDTYLLSLNPPEESSHRQIETLQTFPRNAGFYLSWFMFGQGTDRYSAMECRWTASVEPTRPQVSLRFWSDGRVEVWRGIPPFEEMVAEGHCVDREVSYPQAVGKEVFTRSAKGRQLAGQFVQVLMIPCRHRELLILSNQGGGFNVRFDDIAPDAPSPIITPRGRFRVYVPKGQVKVQIAPVLYPQRAHLLTDVLEWRVPPAEGATIERTTYYDLPGFGFGNIPDVTIVDAEPPFATFIPDGERSRCRLRVNLAAWNVLDLQPDWYWHSPSIYGASARIGSEVADTFDSTTELQPYLMAEPDVRLSVPDDPGGVRLSFELNQPQTFADIEPAGDISRIGNRTVKVQTDETPPILWFGGRTENPKLTVMPDDRVSRVAFECRDYWYLLERQLIADPLPLDGLELSDAVKTLVKLAGFVDADFILEDSGFYLPTVGQESSGEWALLPESGDTVADWVRRLWETYAQTWVYGFVPTTEGVKFRFVSKEGLGNDPVATLYHSLQQSSEPSEWYRSCEITTLQPEANHIYVVGFDARSKKPFRVEWRDDASADPTLPPEDRPDNWLGEVKSYGWVDPSITTEEAANYALAVLVERLSRRRTLAEWECELIIKEGGTPGWVGDCVTLSAHGTFRIVSMAVQFLSEPEGGEYLTRRATYVGEDV